MADETKPKSKRGFARMSPERRHEIASKGGRSVPTEKRAFSKNKTLAQEAGRKGGLAVPPERRVFAVDKELASTAGRKGALAASSKATPDKG